VKDFGLWVAVLILEPYRARLDTFGRIFAS
jgi:hypothetical protein